MVVNTDRANRHVATEQVVISPPNFRYIEIPIVGTAPLVIARFSEKAKAMIKAKHEAGSTTSKGKTAKDARDFDLEYEASKYVSEEGWNGVHAASFRNGAIDACRAVGYKMTHAKLALFVVADGEDKYEHTPLVQIRESAPERWITHVRNATGVADLRSRPMWPTGWKMRLRLRFDGDMFTQSDVVNLISRVGIQVGVGEGRPYSKQSAGLGFGTFEIEREPYDVPVA